MEETNGILKAMLKELQYQTKLLEAIYEMYDEAGKQSQGQQAQMVNMVMRSITSHPVFEKPGVKEKFEKMFLKEVNRNVR